MERRAPHHAQGKAVPLETRASSPLTQPMLTEPPLREDWTPRTYTIVVPQTTVLEFVQIERDMSYDAAREGGKDRCEDGWGR